MNRTYYDLTEAEALEIGIEEWGRSTAQEKIANGLADKIQFGKPPGDGLGRWREALTSLACEHGLSGLKKTLEEIGFPDAEVPQSAFDIVAEIEADEAEHAR